MTTPEQKQQLTSWFFSLQARICAALEDLEQEQREREEFGHKSGTSPLSMCTGKFDKKTWHRTDKTQENDQGGGGTMSVLYGRVFEKAGVNVSTVHGQFPSEFAAEIPGASKDPSFWASGISLVIHPLNPFVPAVHMNTRHIITEKSWFGGGADLTPTFEFEQDTHDFHAAFQRACDRFDPAYYPEFKKWCDTYFYLPHRQEARGIGGIFYDNINTGSFENDFAFTMAVGEAFLEIYPQLVRRHMDKPWGEAEKQQQLIKRGRYAEFNLLYDRGTKFGLKTDGNIEAILMSLPPMASWSTAA